MSALDDLDGPAKLRKALEAQGRDLAWLRRAIGTGAGTVYRWASGSRTPGPKYALLIQGALGLDARTWEVRSVKRERAPRERKAKPGKVSRPAQERFAAFVKVDEVSGCHIWQGAKSQGYGRFSMPDLKILPAHRVAWEWANGPITHNLAIGHKCANRACVNAEHLEALPMRELISNARSNGNAKWRQLGDYDREMPDRGVR